MFRTATFFAFTVCAWAAANAATGTAPATTPTDTVSAFHATITDAMTHSAKLGCEGRLKLMRAAVDETFDLPFIAERALRRHWKTLDGSQHVAFTAAMRTSVITTYATEFAAPGAVTFATGSTEALPNGDAVVHTTLTPHDGTALTLDYVLKPRNEHWQVVNVLADGVSDLALRATQYDGLMKGEGFTALMGKLDAQTQTLKARCQ